MKRFTSLLACLMFCCGVAMAQTAPSGDVAKRQADKRQAVASSLALSETEAKVFWPVYDAYQTRLAAINERSQKLIERYAAAQRAGSVDEAQAGAMIKEMGTLNEDEFKAITALMGEVGKVLPLSKALRYLQIENKLRAGEKSTIAEAIPLAPATPR